MGFPQPVRPTIQGIAATPLQRRPDGKIHFARVDVKYEGSELAHIPFLDKAPTCLLTIECRSPTRWRRMSLAILWICYCFTEVIPQTSVIDYASLPLKHG